MESTNFALEGLIDNVFQLVKLKAEDKAVLLVKNLAEGLPINLLGDPLRLGQVLINLTNNAIKFSHSGDAITINIKVVNESDTTIVLHFLIQDRGIGISDEQQQKLFKPFIQADSSTTREYGGTGLGLIISKNIIEMMNGKIWVESKESVGSIFHFTVEFQKSHGETQIDKKYILSEQLESAKKQLSDTNILLVEDNKINQLVAKKLLGKHKIQIEIANNGKEALKLLEEHSFDGILMDCMMPVMDGYETTRQIRQQDKIKDIPIIAMTANAMKQDVEKVLSVGMNDHIAKPIEPETMLITMAKWINI